MSGAGRSLRDRLFFLPLRTVLKGRPPPPLVTAQPPSVGGQPPSVVVPDSGGRWPCNPQEQWLFHPIAHDPLPACGTVGPARAEGKGPGRISTHRFPVRQSPRPPPPPHARQQGPWGTPGHRAPQAKKSVRQLGQGECPGGWEEERPAQSPPGQGPRCRGS